jgi:hypothetical protein
MNTKLKLLSFAMLTIGATPALHAQSAGNPPTRPTTSKATGVLKPATPATLNGFLAVPSELNAGDALAFHFNGIGHCKIHVDAGNGLSTDFEGELPFNADYTYQNIGLSSNESYKKFTATATPLGSCKLTGDTKTAKITLNNPTPGGATPPSPVVVSSAGSTLKVANPPQKIVPTIKSIVLTTTAATGTPKVANTMAAGAPMTLTVNGTGVCKYSLDIVQLEKPKAAQPHLVRSSSLQTPFPITETMWPTTPAGTYTWTANGQEGCSGSAAVTIVAQ